MTGNPSLPDETRWLRVEIGEVVVSKGAAEVLTTSAPVGSCVAVSLWDPVSGVAGLLHFRLPDSKLNPAQAESEPAIFAERDRKLDAARDRRRAAREGVRAAVGSCPIRSLPESSRGATMADGLGGG